MIKIRVDKSDRCSEDYSLFVSFPYDREIINTIRSFPSRFWNPDTKEWETSIKHLDKLKSIAGPGYVKITGKTKALQAKSDVNIQHEYKTKPYKHQIEGFNYGLKNNRWLLGDEQGLGKTKQVIDIAVAHKNNHGYKRCLVICGVNGLKWNWKEEIATHSNENSWILGQRKRKTKNTIVIGSNQDKLDDLYNIHNIDAYFLITNIESLRSAKIANTLAQLCADGVIDMVAVDEIHTCRNPSSQQGKGLLKLKPKYRVALTGTPVMNNPLDVYIILKWLGYESHSFYQFKNYYCVMGGYGGYEVIGYKNLPKLKTIVDDIMLRRRKEDVLDLPDKIYINEYVEMSPKQEQIYKEVITDIRHNIDRIKLSPNPLSELIRLRQATGYTGILSSTIKESAKIDRLVEIVDESVENGRKVLIYSNWTDITSYIFSRLSKKYHGVTITGDTPDGDRKHNMREFQENDNCKFILGTIGAMGAGYTLTAGTVVIFADEPWTMASKQQAIDRCHRIGTKNNITIYTLMCKDTIDERIHDIVEKKGMMSDAIIDGKIIGNKIELLDFLLS